jgi:uncharacterized protein (TIGR02453 family)
MARFSGFPVEAVAFYEQLEQHNTKEFWAEHKATYESAVREPMRSLLEELAGEFGEGTVFRPYRDLRFSKDKTPYKTHQGGFAQTHAGSGYYVHLDSDGLMAGGGFHAHSPAQVERFRKAVDDDGTGEPLAAIVAALEKAGFEIGGETLKTRPKGYAADHPRIDLLRHKTLTAAKHFGTPAWLARREALTRVKKAWTAIRPLDAWIGEHVGAPNA